MKETKTFFANNNRLNKGYAKTTSPEESDNSFYKKKFEHIMPPVDFVSQYEEIHPGTFAKVLDMAEQEQHHKHSLDLLGIEVYNRAAKLGRIFALIFTIVICLSVMVLALFDHVFLASILIISAFLSVGVTSYFANKSAFEKKYRPR
jgi:uncharacterized membrane protein